MLSYFKPHSALAAFRFIIDSTGSGITPVASQEATQAKHQEAGRRWRRERRVSSKDTAGWNLLKCHRKSIFHSRYWSWLDFGPINNECMAYLTRHSPRGWGRLWLDRLVTRNTLLPHSVRPQVSCSEHKTFHNNLHLKAPLFYFFIFTSAWPSRVRPQPHLCQFCLYKSSLSLESSVDWWISSAVRNFISVLCLSSHHPGDLSQKPILLKCQTARLCMELHGDNSHILWRDLTS